MDFVPAEKAVPIRYPSTANLMVDSKDRNQGTAWNFQIQRNQSLLNGFFTRIATTEVTLEWFIPNGGLYSEKGNGLSITYGTNAAIEVLLDGTAFYTVEEALDFIVATYNAAAGSALLKVIVPSLGSSQAGIGSADDTTNITIDDGPLAIALGFATGAVAASVQLIFNPDLRPYRYLDFVSAQLTYNQDLKDASTKLFVRDVLCRWYFAWDTPPAYDGYGYPILMGYTSFVQRRLFNPPKQIRWDPKQVVGNIAFEVWGDGETIIEDVSPKNNSQWLMSLQISEC